MKSVVQYRGGVRTVFFSVLEVLLSVAMKRSTKLPACVVRRAFVAEGEGWGAKSETCGDSSAGVHVTPANSSLLLARWSLQRLKERRKERCSWLPSIIDSSLAEDTPSSLAAALGLTNLLLEHFLCTCLCSSPLNVHRIPCTSPSCCTFWLAGKPSTWPKPYS